MLLQPSRNIFRIPLEPRSLCADGVNALGQRHVKALGALALKERLDFLDVLMVCEARCRDGHNGAQHAQARRQSPLKLSPVVLDPHPERNAALRMRPQGSNRQVDVLTLDVFAERKVEGALDELRGLRTSQ